MSGLLYPCGNLAMIPRIFELSILGSILVIALTSWYGTGQINLFVSHMTLEIHLFLDFFSFYIERASNVFPTIFTVLLESAVITPPFILLPCWIFFFLLPILLFLSLLKLSYIYFTARFM